MPGHEKKRQLQDKLQGWLLLVLAALVGCSTGEAPNPPPSGESEALLRVAAAADLRFALPDVIAAFREAQPGLRVEPTFASSGQLVAQIENGAAVDVFLSADEDYAARLVEKGLAEKADYFRYARGHLVLWVPNNSDVDLQGELGEVLRHVKRLAIANPRTAPYGRAAQAVLNNLGLADAYRDHLLLGDNVTQAFQFAAQGGAEAAIVGKALILGSSIAGAGRWREIPSELYPPIIQAGVILKRCEVRAAALAWRDFLLSEAGQAMLRRHGFTSPQAP
ncbi:Molybdate-binding periplasmic protein [bacterium HR36]|nr:Molybdate-binding periplasmic protein [bacterium HR36]